MSLPRYPAYKDSGVAWLGEVPGHWEIKRLGYYFNERREKVSDKDFEPLSVTKNGILPQLETAAKTDDGDNRKKVCKGDFVINSRSDRKGSSGMALQDGSVSLINTVIQPQDEMNIEFAHHLLRSIPFQEEYYRYGKGIVADLWSTNYSEMKNINLAVPSTSEQQVIAAFLDCETGKIDALVAEQKKLIQLLREKRQAVISHAVTKGINPAAPMKDSGIEWLGEVPEHWDVLKGSLIGTLFGSEQVSENSVTDEGELPFIKVGSMSLDSLEIGSWDWFVDSSVASQYSPRSDYIVFPKRGAAIFLNKVNIVDRPSLIDPNLMGWEIGKKALPKFIAYALKSRKLDELADVSTVPQINNKHIAPERFPIPPIDEQQIIVAYIDVETAKLDALTTEAQRGIALLKERRSALISAAVTGKIDVRGKM